MNNLQLACKLFVKKKTGQFNWGLTL